MAEVKKTISEVVANLNHFKQSDRKVRLVAQSVEKMSAREASNKLMFIPRAASKPLAKLIDSAIANAKHNFEIAEDRLFVKSFIVNQGPALKRFRPAAFGQAHPIKKHTCHVRLVLGVKEENNKKADKKVEKETAKKIITKTKEVKEKKKVAKAKKEKVSDNQSVK